MSPPVSEISLYERIGGEPAINAAVERFYERVLADPELKDFFNGVSMSRLKAHQFAFLSQALGGPKQYSGASMATRIPNSRSSTGILTALPFIWSKRCENSASGGHHRNHWRCAYSTL